MQHNEIIAEIMTRAGDRGIKSHYCHDTRRCQGDPGLPDLLLIGKHAAAWIEVKTPGDRLKPDQTRWKYALQAAGQVHEVMGPGDLEPGGAIDMMLSFVSTGQV